MRNLAMFITVTALTACTLFGKREAQSALDAVQIACIFQSSVTDESALADACAIAKDLLPVVRQLIGQREGAKRAGVRWGGVRDAGTDGP